jgi:hypothetical protein
VDEDMGIAFSLLVAHANSYADTFGFGSQF